MENETDGARSRNRLVQTRLTAAFFSPSSRLSTTGSSPYFTKPATAAVADDDTRMPDSSHDADDEDDAPSSTAPSTRHSSALAAIAQETLAVLPALLARNPHAPPTGILYTDTDSTAASPPHSRPTHALHAHRNPHHAGTRIRVLNADSLDAALALSERGTKRVLVLNMANATRGGGGWLRGAQAQEESLCYRSSLALTLKRRFYPLRGAAAVYSPTVLVVREAAGRGHGFLLPALPPPPPPPLHDDDDDPPPLLPVVSVVSVAAPREPPLAPGPRYARAADERAMRARMRLVLRVAGRERHGRLVLAALGCGAFANPRAQVARLWREVLAEAEFLGWWEELVFAVLEPGGHEGGAGNFGVFWRELDGVAV